MNRRMVAWMTAFAVVFSMFISTDVFAGDNFSIFRTVSPEGELYAGQTITLTYTIQPADIMAQQIDPKEISLIIDGSGSMFNNKIGNDTRMKVAQDAACLFIDKLGADPNITVHLITYANNGDYIGTYNLGTQLSTLKTEVRDNSNYTRQWTNMGDAIRVGKYALTDTTADQYLVFLTDGYPTAYSQNKEVTANDYEWLRYYQWDDINEEIGISQMDFWDWAHYYYDLDTPEYRRFGTYNGNYYCYEQNGTTTKWVYSTGSDDPDSTRTNSQSSGQAHAIAMMNNIKDYTTIEPTYIAFTPGALGTGTYSLKNAAKSVYGDAGYTDYYEDASGATELTSVYNKIAEDITASYNFTDLYFEEQFPEDITIHTNQIGLSNSSISLSSETDSSWVKLTSNNTLQLTFPDDFKWEYSLTSDKTKYVAAPITLTIDIAADEPGIYELGDNYAAFTYKDGETTITPSFDMPDTTIEVHRLNPPTINMSSEPGTGSKYFTLSDNASGNMFLMTTDDIEFKGAWQNDLFSSSSDTWTVNALIRPNVISGSSNNIFLTKEDDLGNSNLEVGVDNGSLYLRLVGADGTDINRSIGATGSIAGGSISEIIISYNQGVVAAYIDGVEYIETFWDTPQGLKASSTGSLFFGGSFDGRMNLVEFYDQAVTDAEIFDGTAANLVARYTPDDLEDQGDDDGTNDVLISTSGIGVDTQSEPVGSVYIQQSAASSVGAGATKMQYMISNGGIDGTWQDYNGKTLLRDTPGSSTVFARTVLVADTDRMSEENEKTGSVKEPMYIDDIRISASPTNIELYSDLDALTKSEVTLTYELVGGLVELGDRTDEIVSIDDLDVLIDLGPTADFVSGSVSDATYVDYTSADNTLEVRLSGLTLHKVAGTVHSYMLYDDADGDNTVAFEVDVVSSGSSKATDVNDIKIDGELDDGNSVTVTYDDVYGNPKSFTDGEIVNVEVQPTEPIIDTVNVGDRVFYPNVTAVPIKCQIDPYATVTITVSDDSDPTNVYDFDTVEDTDGDGWVTTKDFDLSAFKYDDPLNPFTVDAEVDDGDGEHNEADRPADIVNIKLDNEIL